MADRSQMIQELKRRDMISQLKARDAAQAEGDATIAAAKKFDDTKPSAAEAAMLGATQGGLRNFGDEIAGGVANLLGKDGDAVKANMQDRIKRSKDEQPVAYGGGEIASKVATLPMTANPLAAAGIAATDTAASGIGDDKSAKDIAVETALSGGTAGFLTKYLPALSSGAKDKMSSILQGRADKQAIKALGGSQGQIQKLGDKVPEVAQMIRDEKIITPLSSSSKIAENSQAFGDRLAEQAKPIYEASKDSKMGAADLISQIETKIADLKSNPGNAPIIAKLQGYIDDITSSGTQEFNPGQIRGFRQSVDKTVNFASDAPAQLAKQDMRWLLRDNEMGLIDKVDPALRQTNEKLFRNMHLNGLAEDMAEKGAAKSAANNDIGLNTWQAMNVAADLGTGGVKTMVIGAIREGARRFGPQMEGIYLDKAAKAMQNPKFAKILEDAAKRSPEAVVSALSVIDKMGDQ